jgi:hypothetical protein
MLDYHTFFPELIKSVPEFAPFYKAELAEELGELLPHPMMGEVARFCLQLYRQSFEDSKSTGEEARKVVAKILAFLEQAMGSADERVPELISVSFLENSGGEHRSAEMSELFGPRLREQFREMEQVFGWSRQPTNRRVYRHDQR